MKIRNALLVTASAAALALSGFALAQGMHPGMSPGAQGGMPAMNHEHMSQMMDMGMQDHHQMGAADAPSMAGQAAFSAIQEIVRLLEADPATDWTKVNIAALRDHLVDMDEVTMRATAVEKPIDGGLEIAVGGSGRTLDAIRRMVPEHAQELSKLDGWSAKTSDSANGVVLTVTTTDPKEVTHIRGLGFFGLLATGSHHQLHHMAMARGEPHLH